jgi:hypothetical protein
LLIVHYDADWIRAFVNEQGAWANVPPRSNRREPICFSPHLYRARNLVERFFNKIKQCRRVATRYDNQIITKAMARAQEADQAGERRLANKRLRKLSARSHTKLTGPGLVSQPSPGSYDNRVVASGPLDLVCFLSSCPFPLRASPVRYFPLAL